MSKTLIIVITKVLDWLEDNSDVKERAHALLAQLKILAQLVKIIDAHASAQGMMTSSLNDALVNTTQCMEDMVRVTNKLEKEKKGYIAALTGKRVVNPKRFLKLMANKQADLQHCCQLINLCLHVQQVFKPNSSVDTASNSSTAQHKEQPEGVPSPKSAPAGSLSLVSSSSLYPSLSSPTAVGAEVKFEPMSPTANSKREMLGHFLRSPEVIDLWQTCAGSRLAAETGRVVTVLTAALPPGRLDQRDREALALALDPEGHGQVSVYSFGGFVGTSLTDAIAALKDTVGEAAMTVWWLNPDRDARDVKMIEQQCLEKKISFVVFDTPAAVFSHLERHAHFANCTSLRIITNNSKVGETDAFVGHELVRGLRERGCDAPVLVYTGKWGKEQANTWKQNPDCGLVAVTTEMETAEHFATEP